MENCPNCEDHRQGAKNAVCLEHRECLEYRDLWPWSRAAYRGFRYLIHEAHDSRFILRPSPSNGAPSALGGAAVRCKRLLGGMVTSLAGRFISRLDCPWRVYLEKSLPLSLLVLAPQGNVSAWHGGTAFPVNPFVRSNDVPEIT